jgi:hypothetical protein
MTPPTFHVALTLITEARVNPDGTVTLGPLTGADLTFLAPGALLPFHRAEATLPELPVHPLWQAPLQEAADTAAEAFADLCRPRSPEK